MRASWPDLSQCDGRWIMGKGELAPDLTNDGHMNSIHTDIPPPPNFERCRGAKSGMLTLKELRSCDLVPPTGGLCRGD